MFLLILQRIFIDLLLDVVYFPLWWYTRGAKKILLRCWDSIKETNLRLAPGLWLKNLFVPMYGQTDWQGRIMSVFMRLVNVIGRGIALLFYILFMVAAFLFWIAFPILLIFLLLSSFIGLVS